MFYHIKILLRRLRRNVIYSGINIAGLTIGITASVLIFLWVYHERSFDTCYPDNQRIYRIINTSEFNGQLMTSSVISLPFIQACERDIPEIEDIAIFLSARSFNAITVNHTLFSVQSLDGVFLDRVWLELFHNTVVDGSLDAYGNHPFSVTLTESGAKKYFGDSQPIGQTVRINNADYTVQAVVKDNPTNSSFRYHIMASIDAVLSDPEERQELETWNGRFMSFVKLRSNADASQIAQKMNDILDNNSPMKEYGVKMEASLELLTDMYFSEVADFFSHGNAKIVSIFSLLGILLLCVACINYINLTMARVTQRSKEVGIKKIVGAKRRSLFVQFVAESFTLCLIATIIAIFLIQLSIPLFQTLVGNIPVSFSSPAIWVITGIALLFVTVLNGVYPALMLSSFHPVNSLKGMSLPKVKAGNLRKALVVFQFVLSAATIICVIVIFKQTRYMQNIDPGFRKDHIVRLRAPNTTLMSLGQDHAILSLQTIKGSIQTCPDVVSVSLGNEYIENNGSTTNSVNADWDGRTGDYPSFSPLRVDADFMDVYELQLREGRWFGVGEADMQNVILNETAIREYGIIEPYIGQRFDLSGMKGHIIGVVKDFHFRSLHEKITPLVIYQRNPLLYTLNIKIQEGQSAEAIRAIGTIWSEFFPNDPFDYVFIDDSFAQLYKSDIRILRMIFVFSVLAVVIAMLGLFGLSVFAAERRTKEIGIRKVFGASVPDIVRLLTREFFVLVAIAFVIAAPVAWWAMNRWLENFAYHIDITVWIFISGAMVTLVIALIAVGFQSIKSAIANPVNAIKSE